MTVPAHRHLRAPTADGAALIDPPLSEAAKLIEQNRAIGAKLDQLAGFSDGFRDHARFLALLSTDASDSEWLAKAHAPIVISGHQPDLFHPGVWLKNFVLSAIAQSAGGLGLNLVIDSDTIRTASIRVLAGSVAVPRIEEVSFDASGDDVPWEQREVLDHDLFRSFADRVRSKFASHTTGPAYRHGMLLDELWPIAVEAKNHALRKTEELLAKLTPSGECRPVPPEILAAKQRLGPSLTLARHFLEQQIGLDTQELPLAMVCITEQFMEFSDQLFTRHREFHDAYNSALAEFRAINGIRDERHPVPSLARVGEWYEMPYWIWNAPHDIRRRRAYVRQAGSSWELTDLEGMSFRPPGGSGRSMHEMLLALIQSGPTLRPRALITTMYARLVLSDLFIHGIGGAKYDEVTDGIIRRFFGIEPPKYITATATFRLPIDRPQVTIEDLRDARRKLRDVRYRPETFLKDPITSGEAGLRDQLQALADEKREFVQTHDLRRCEAQVFQRLDTLNRAMHDLLRPVEQELHTQHSLLIEQLHRAQLLGSREFSFCLFPADELPARLLALSKVSA